MTSFTIEILKDINHRLLTDSPVLVKFIPRTIMLLNFTQLKETMLHGGNVTIYKPDREFEVQDGTVVIKMDTNKGEELYISMSFFDSRLIGDYVISITSPDKSYYSVIPFVDNIANGTYWSIIDNKITHNTRFLTGKIVNGQVNRDGSEYDIPHIEQNISPEEAGRRFMDILYVFQSEKYNPLPFGERTSIYLSDGLNYTMYYRGGSFYVYDRNGELMIEGFKYHSLEMIKDEIYNNWERLTREVKAISPNAEPYYLRFLPYNTIEGIYTIQSPDGNDIGYITYQV